MKNIIRLYVPLILATLVIGCASSQMQSKFTADTVNTIKTGMAKNEVIAMLGEPRSHAIDNDGNEIWQYRKNAQEGKGVKMFSDITSFGMTSGIDADYQDILTVAFKKDVVVKATYEENVHNRNGLRSQN